MGDSIKNISKETFSFTSAIILSLNQKHRQHVNVCFLPACSQTVFVYRGKLNKKT